MRRSRATESAELIDERPEVESGTLAGPAISVDKIVKEYGGRRVVNELSFEVTRGEIFSLLGPNGAGKTTTVEILEGYRHPDAGSVKVLGLNPQTEGSQLKPRIGVMLQQGGFYPAMTPREGVSLFARYYPHHRDVESLLTLVGMEGAADIRYRRLSGGQKQRLALALALIGEPELVFLDEPTAGLDPQARRTTWDIVAGLRQHGVTILLTTHYLEEAERLADRVGIIDEGRLIALGSPSELVRSDQTTVRLRTASPVPVGALQSLPAVQRVREDSTDAYSMETLDPPSLLVQVTSYLQEVGISAVELRVGKASLEEVFFDLTGKGLER